MKTSLSFFSVCLAISIVLALSISACSPQKSAKTEAKTVASSKQPVIVGTIVNIPTDKAIFFDQVKLDKSRMVYSKNEVDEKGNFEIDLPEPFEAGLYTFRIGSTRFSFPLNGTEKKIEIEGDYNTLESNDVKVKGSSNAKLFVEKMRASQNGSFKTEDIEAFVKETTSEDVAQAYLAAKLLKVEEKNLEVFNILRENLKNNYSGTVFLKDYSKFVDGLKMAIAKAKVQQIKVGYPAPDIKDKSPTGETYALSDLKGKVVLLDFWASWCGPCRKANPHVVEMYHKYKDQGFTVFSVSLDGIDTRSRKRYPDPEKLKEGMANQKKRWVSAIEKDQLTWDYHVSDLSKWESIHAAIYGVRSIPKTFLIDREGNIAYINPRNNLETQLQKLL